VTIDHVNPEFPWPSITTIDEITRKCGFSLRARLPIYPEFIFNDSFISQDLKSFVKPISDEFGLVPEGYLL
jgi:FO synthase